MKLEWLLLAEGLGQDARGAITAIGVGQNVVPATKLPTFTKRALIAHFADEKRELKVDDTVLFSFTVAAPSGKVIGAQSGQASIAGQRWTELPGAMDIPGEFALNLTEYGDHKMSVVLTLPSGEEISGSLILYVVDPRKSSAS